MAESKGTCDHKSLRSKPTINKGHAILMPAAADAESIAKIPIIISIDSYSQVIYFPLSLILVQ